MGTPGAQAPARLGRYELLARLATGGMGEIFLARLEGAAGFEKLFVVKRILPHLADDARFRAMLIGEARIASKMSHANICQVYELGETDGQLYIVMEYLEGVALLPLLRRASKQGEPLEFGLIAGVIQQTTDALHYAHELKERTGEYMGIVHRDVTPGNVFLTDAGVAKVLDFGIAKVKDATAHTQTGTVKGKYAYMAPEQLRGSTIDRRADVFALGVVIYEMVALRRLFQRKTDYLTFRAVMEQPVPDLRRYRPDAPDALADVVARALERDPAGRWDTARQLGAAVLDALAPIGRPWSQGEISDYVRANFADEIGRRSAQVATAVHRTEPSGIGRTTMPLIAQTDAREAGSEDDDDDDDGFPSVESATSGGFRNQPTQGTADFQGSTPPPFGADSHVSMQNVQPFHLQPTVTMVGKRSLVWPMLAIAMVMIAGGALFLVWRQMQQPAQPTVVNITAQPADPGPVLPQVEPGAASGSAPSERQVADSGSGPRPGGSAGPEQRFGGRPTDRARTVPKQQSENEYTIVLRAHRTEMTECATRHGSPPANARVIMVVATDGRAKDVTFEPAQLNRMPLAACIKSLLLTMVFPTAKKEINVAFALALRGAG